ncbi:ABC transporter substrate-binding protein, partial [Pseudomonas sp. SIMBA_067]
MRKTLRRHLLASLFLLGAPTLLPAVAAAADNQQFVPMATYRVGAYASSGIPWWAGEIDYFRYINEVEGGINGVKLTWQECETEWNVDRILECYERY